MVIEDDTGRIHKIQIPNTAYSVGNSSKLLSKTILEPGDKG